MTVSTLINDARGYAAGLIDDAKDAIDDATAQVQSVGYVVPNFYPAVLPAEPPAEPALTPPTLQPVDLDLPQEPAATLNFQDIPPLDAGVAPVLSAAVPALTMPTKPSQVAEFAEDAPVISTSLVFPEPPAELMNPFVQEPSLPDRQAPAKPTIALPSFDAVKPDGLPAAPENLGATMESAYRGMVPVMASQVEGYVDAQLTKWNPQFHVQMGRIEEQLAKYLQGGTGFTPAVENALYERSQGKNAAEARRLAKAALRDAADRGFTMPPGAALATVRAARQAAGDNNARAATEIVVMQAEMEQKNLQFAVSTSMALRTALVSATLSHAQNLITINGQALDFAKTVVSSLIETYNAAVRAFTARLDVYRAEAAVYETRLKASMAEMELYEAEIKALQALTDVDRAKVDIYRARIDVLKAQGDIYKTRVEAILGQASLEKLKIDLFQAKVQAHSARVSAKNAEWQGYIASIEGETAKVKIFGEQVNAYQAQTRGYEATVSAKAKVIDAAAVTNKARADQFLALQSNFKTVVEARGEKARVQLENQRQEIVSFQTQAQAAVARAEVKATYYRVTSQAAISNAEMRFRTQVEEARSRREFGEALAKLSALAADIHGKLAAASVSGMNSLAAETLQQ